MDVTKTHRVATPHDPVKVALAALSNDRRSGTIIVGPVGSGKTFTLRAVVNEVSISSRMSSRLQVVQASSCRRSDLTAILGRLGADSPRHEPQSAIVLAADDLDLWEPGALTLLSDALDQGNVRLLGAVRSAALITIMSLLRPARPTALTALEPWRLSEFSRYARALLGAPLHVATAQELITFAGGNPLCLAELLDHGRATNKLHRRYETWVWSGVLAVPPVTLARKRQQLQSQTQPVRDLLATLSLTGPIGLDALQKMHPLWSIEQAESEGLIKVAIHGGGAIDVALSNPLEGQVILQTQATLRGRALGARTVTAINEEPKHGRAYGQIAARVALRYGLPIPESLTLPAAAAALQTHDIELARSLLTNQQHQLEGVELLASTLVEECRFAEAADALTRWVSRDEANDHRRGTMARRDALLSMSLSQPGTSSAIATPARPTQQEVSYVICANSWAGLDLEQSLRRGAAALTRAPHGSEQHRCLVATLSLYTQLGLVERAVHLAQEVESSALARFAPAHRLTFLAVLGISHIARGALKDAQWVSSSLCNTAVEEGWPLAYAMGAFIAGRCALLQARPALALRRLSESLASFERAVPLLNRTVLFESLALGYSLEGKSTEAEAAHRQANHEVSRCAPQFLEALARLTYAEVLHLQGHQGRALDAATSVVESSTTRGQKLITMLGLHLIVRIQPSPNTTQQLAHLANNSDMALAETYANHAQAADAQDVTGLEQVARTYDDAGLRWLAAETAAVALRCGRSTRTLAPATHRLKRLINQLHEEEQVVTPHWWGSEANYVTPLTAREKQIAEAAITGTTSSRIAEELGLSRRTVENHLQHVFRKYDVTSREELAQCLSASGASRSKVN